MKKNQITLMLLLFTVLLTVNTYAQLTNGLKAYYPFGGDANDISGQNNNGQLVGTPTLTTDRFGTANCAYSFPGNASTYISVPYSSDFNIAPTGAFSISIWYQGGTASMGDFEELFNKNDPAVTPTPSDYHVALYDLNRISFGSQYSPVVMSSVTPPIPDANWHHAVAIYDNKNWYIYEDDVLTASSTSQSSTIFQSTSGNISIGKNFQGRIDDIRFYDRVLTTTEIHDIYTLPSSCGTTGINEVKELSSITVFPNPTANRIHVSIKNTRDMIDASVFDMNGKEIMKQRLSEEETTLDLTSYPNGFYLLRITENGTIQRRIIEKRD